VILLRLFYEFFKTGLFSIGGGLATLPFLYDISNRTGWFTHSQLTDMIAISESTPGPIGVNMATYVGFNSAGIPGAVAATLGLVTPSVIIILLIAKALTAFRSNKYVNALFYSLRPASTGLIAASGFALIMIVFFNKDVLEQGRSFLAAIRMAPLALGVLIFVLTRIFKKAHPAIFILLSALVGIVFKFGEM